MRGRRGDKADLAVLDLVAGFLLVKPVCDGGSRRLVDDPQNIKPGYHAGILCCLRAKSVHLGFQILERRAGMPGAAVLQHAPKDMVQLS